MPTQAETQVLVEDLSLRWFYLDEAKNQYFPITYQSLAHLKSVSFFISEHEFSGHQLKLVLPQGTSVFLNQNIIAQSNSVSNFIWDVDSLRNSMAANQLFFNVYSSKTLDGLLETNIVARNHAINLQKGLDEHLPIARKDFGQFVSFFIIASLIVLVLISVLRRVHAKYFDDFYGFNTFFRNRIRDDAFLRSGLLNPISLTFYSVHSLLLGLLLLAFVRYYPEIPSSLLFLKGQGMQLPWITWLLSSFLIFALILCKYVLISYFGRLFAIRVNQVGHFTDYMQMSLLFFLLVFMLVFVGFKWLTNSPFAVSIILAMVLVFSFFRVVVLFFKLMRQTNFRNLHLISYLCATELIPLLISIKLFL